MDSRSKAEKPEYKLKGPARTTVTPNHFFAGGGADVCDMIGSHTTTQTLGRLARVSKSTKYYFEKSLNLHHDAHVILQAIMNDHEAVPHLLQQAAGLYKANVWKLLLQPVPGTEEHCGRHWNNVSAISFAALSGNLYQYLYELVPMPQDENAELEQGKLYVAIESLGISNENVLTYRVINTEGKLLKNSIYQAQLGCTLSDPLNLEELNACLPTIMAITYERGETNDVNPQHPEIAATYLLNLLFEYIPQEFRKFANEQLLNMQASGSVMQPYIELVREYDACIKNYNDATKTKTETDRNKLNTAWVKGAGGKQKSLPWLGLRVMCDEIVWNPMPDFNHLRAPAGEAMLIVNYSETSLKSCLSKLGSSWAVYHHADGSPMWGWAIALCDRMGDVTLNRDVIHHFVEVKNMQLGAFIAWQQLLEEKYREEQKHSLSLNRR